MPSTKASNDRTSWTYTDDLGNVYSIGAKSVYVTDPTDGAKYGGALAVAADLPIPGNMKPRMAEFIGPSGEIAWVVCYTDSCAAWATAETTLTRDYHGVDTLFTKGTRNRGESRNRRSVYPGH